MRTSKHVAVVVIGAVLTMAAQSSAQVPGDAAPTASASDARSDSPAAPPGDATQGDLPREGDDPGQGRDTCARSCGADAAPAAPPFVPYTAALPDVVDPDQLRFSVDRNAVRAAGWVLAIVGLATLATGLTAPLVAERAHEPRGPHKSESPSWAVPLAIGGGVGLVGGLVVVAACGPVPSDQPAVRGQPERTVGLGYRGTF